MKKYLQKKLNNEKGMTLIELLAVIVIIAIIAAIAIPAIGNIIENSRYSAVKSDALNALAAANIYYTENPQDVDGVTIKELADAGYLESQGKLLDANSIVNATDGLELTTGAIKFSGNKAVTFDDATIEGINANTTKGSEVPATGVVIGTQPEATT